MAKQSDYSAPNNTTGLNLTGYNAGGTVRVPISLLDGQTQGVVSAMLKAGANVTLTPNQGGTEITIAAAGGGGGGGPWTFGSGAPDNQNGSDGDIYVDTDNNNVYQKASGDWGSPVANFTGAAGAVGSYAAVRVVSADGDITDADVGKLLVFTDAKSLDLLEANFAEGDWVDVYNGTDDKIGSITADDGIGDGAVKSIDVHPRKLIRVVRHGVTDPYWVADQGLTVPLVANEAAVVNSTGTAQEGRAQIVVWPLFIEATADGTYPIGRWTGYPWSTLYYGLSTLAGTCSVVVNVGGSAADGFSPAVGLTTTPADAASEEDVAKDDAFSITVSGASGLTGVYLTVVGVRTGNLYGP